MSRSLPTCSKNHAKAEIVRQKYKFHKELRFVFITLVAIFNTLTLSAVVQPIQISSTTTGGEWGNASTWVGGNVPSSTDDVIISGNVYALSSVLAASITVDANDTLTFFNSSSSSVLSITCNGAVVYSGIPAQNIIPGTYSSLVLTGGSKLLAAGKTLNVTNMFVAASCTFVNEGTASAQNLFGGDIVNSLINQPQTTSSFSVSGAISGMLYTDSHSPINYNGSTAQSVIPGFYHAGLTLNGNAIKSLNSGQTLSVFGDINVNSGATFSNNGTVGSSAPLGSVAIKINNGATYSGLGSTNTLMVNNGLLKIGN